MGRTKNQIQKPATVHQLKSGKWAVFVTLVEPRELEGKMRSGRQKFERQTQALANDLCAEVNAQLCGKELARQLSDREQEMSKKVFWEILEPNHPDWVDHLVDIVRHAEKTGFRPADDTVPTIAEAAKIYYREHMVNLEKETRSNYRNVIAFLLPVFGHLKAWEMTDQQILQVAYGTEPLNYLRSTGKSYHSVAEREARVWDSLEESRSKRTWTSPMIERFLQIARIFRNWMHESKDPVTQAKRNWCPRSGIESVPRSRPQNACTGEIKLQDSDRGADSDCLRNPALTIPQVQALIDVAWVVYGGRYAPFYVHGLWCGSRSKEISRTNVTAFNSHDGILAVSDLAAKTDQGRESEVYPNTIAMVEALRSAGLYTANGLRPGFGQRGVIQVLAGFASHNKQALSRAERERKRLEARGIILPRYNWGIAFPQNALRRTGLSMHYKLFLNVPFTTGWAGNSPRVFKEFYKRLVTKQQAREYWIMLPTWLRAKAAIQVELPRGHKLDSAITETVKTTVSAACEAMSAFTNDAARDARRGLRKSEDPNSVPAELGDREATAASSKSPASELLPETLPPSPAVAV
jgi:hypothetical protein